MENRRYEDVYAELEALVKTIEDPERDLSSIGADVKKAMELIKWCRACVQGSLEQVEQTMKEA